MPYVIVTPERLAAAAADIAGIGSTLSEARHSGRPDDRGVTAGADEVSAAIAALFSTYGKEFQALGAHADAFHAQFVQALASGAGSYATTEANNGRFYKRGA